MLSKLQLILILQARLQVIPPISLLLLYKLAQRHAHEPRYIVLMFS
jgi:hypothetical protein